MSEKMDKVKKRPRPRKHKGHLNLSQWHARKRLCTERDPEPALNGVVPDIVPDIVPETVPEVVPPPPPPLEEKINELEGSRIVSLSFLLKQIWDEKHAGGTDCTFMDMDFVGETRRGLQCSWRFKCRVCNKQSLLKSHEQSDSELPVNTSAVNGAIAAGVGFSQLAEYHAAMNLPFMSQQTFCLEEALLRTDIHNIAWQSIEEAGKEEREYALATGNVDKNGTPLCTVVADGQWSKRTYGKNYNALSGSAVIIGYLSKKIIFFGIRNKYCVVCDRAKAKGLETKEHQCFKNWTGSSTSMETDIVTQGFKESVELHGLIFNELIGDGDSSVTSSLQSIKPYGPHMMVKKIECTNHLLRNMDKKASNVMSETKFPSKLRNKMGDRLPLFRSTVKSLVKHYSECDLELEEAAAKLQKEIMNIPMHVSGHHEQCSTVCEKEPEEDFSSEVRSSGMMKELQVPFDYLADRSESLLHKMNNNAAESFNNIVAKHIGGKRVNYSQRGSYTTRVEAAVISHNSGYLRKFCSSKKITQPAFVRKYTDGLLKKRNRNRLSKRKRSKRKRAGPDSHYGRADPPVDISSQELEEKKKSFIESLRVTEETAREIEKLTRDQAKSERWRRERRDRLTASVFGEIVNMRSTTSVKNKVWRLVYGRKVTKKRLPAPLQYGIDTEPIAKSFYREAYKVDVNDCGLFIYPDVPYLAASPDGLLDPDTLLEIKCPFTARVTASPEEAIESKKIEYLQKVDGRVCLMKSHTYYCQIQGQLNICRKKMCKLLVYTPLWQVTEDIPINPSFWKDELLPKLQRFYEEAMLPEIVHPLYGFRKQKLDIREAAYVQHATTEKNNKKKK